MATFTDNTDTSSSFGDDTYGAIGIYDGPEAYDDPSETYDGGIILVWIDGSDTGTSLTDESHTTSSFTDNAGTTNTFTDLIDNQ